MPPAANCAAECKRRKWRLEDLLEKFDATLENSSYAKKYQVRPIFELVDARNVKNKVTLIFHYACADLKGKPIPSYKDNDLYTTPGSSKGNGALKVTPGNNDSTPTPIGLITADENAYI